MQLAPPSKKRTVNRFNFRFLVLFPVGTGVLLKTLKADIMGRPQSVTVQFQIL